jgi:hypothetical protein
MVYTIHIPYKIFIGVPDEEDKRIQGGMREYQKGQPGMNQFVSVYSS